MNKNEMNRRETLAAAQSLAMDIPQARLRLGRVLAQIWEEGWYMPEYRNLTEYAWKELGIKRSTYYAMIQMAQTSDRLRIPDHEVEKIGWTKFYTLCPHLTQGNWREMVEFAKHAPKAALESKLRGRGLMQKSFNGLDQDGLNVVDSALGTAKTLMGARTETEALVAICETFLKAC